MGTICEEKKCIYRNNKSYNHCGTCAGLYDEPLTTEKESVAESPACNDRVSLPLDFAKELAHIGWTANSKLESQVLRNTDLPYAYKEILKLHFALLTRLDDIIKAS